MLDSARLLHEQPAEQSLRLWERKDRPWTPTEAGSGTGRVIPIFAHSTAKAIEKHTDELEAKHAAITSFHQYRSENPAISYTPEAWRALVDHATIHPDGTIAIAFNDGTTI